MRTIRFVALLALSLAIGPVARADFAVTGIPNFRQVNPHLFRGGQPVDTAWPALAKLGVKTVIDLRQVNEHSTIAEAQAVEAAGMRYLNFPMSGFATPRAEQVAQVLEAMTKAGETVFVHCAAGKDRTGTVVAAYRISRDRWKNDQALQEAEACGMHGFERGMKRFIVAYHAPDPTSIPVELASTSAVATAPADSSQGR